MRNIATLIAAVMLASSAFATGTQPPPPKYQIVGNEWAANVDGRIYAGDDPLDLIWLLWIEPGKLPMQECHQSCANICNAGMPSGSPSALCWAIYRAADGLCYCGCRNLDGSCPPAPVLTPVPGQTSVMDLLIDAVTE